jgi:hypothetical protein
MKLKRTLKIILGSVLAALAILAIPSSCAWLWWKANTPICGNTVISEVPSPSQKWRAVIFDRDCGATTRWSTQVSLLRTGRVLPNEAGNIHITNDSAGPGEPPVVKVEWESDDVLKIASKRDVVVLFTVQNYRGIYIRHEHLKE